MIIRRINDPLAMRQISLIWRDTSPLDRSFTTMAEVLRDVSTSILRNDLP